MRSSSKGVKASQNQGQELYPVITAPVEASPITMVWPQANRLRRCRGGWKATISPPIRPGPPFEIEPGADFLQSLCRDLGRRIDRRILSGIEVINFFQTADFRRQTGQPVAPNFERLEVCEPGVFGRQCGEAVSAEGERLEVCELDNFGQKRCQAIVANMFIAKEERRSAFIRALLEFLPGRLALGVNTPRTYDVKILNYNKYKKLFAFENKP